MEIRLWCNGVTVDPPHSPHAVVELGASTPWGHHRVSLLMPKHEAQAQFKPGTWYQAVIEPAQPKAAAPAPAVAPTPTPAPAAVAAPLGGATVEVQAGEVNDGSGASA